MTLKKFQELDLSSAFLFAIVMQDDETCRMVLELILERPISKVKVHAEHSILLSSDFRSVRLDVYAGDETQVDYNLEMQNDNNRNIVKRSRYYQAQMDISSLKPGDDFSELHPNYVIFICAFDPFGLGLYRYTFENRCLERGFPLGDETTKIFLNTKGKNAEEVPDVLVNFLKYLEDSTDESVKELQDQTIEHLHHRVTAVKRNREWEGQYMTIEEFIQDSARAVCEEACEEARKEAHKEGLLEGREEGREEGRAEGRAEGCVEGREEGQEEMLQLIRHMTEAGESEQIFRLTQDRTFFEEMYQKYIILRNK